MWTHLRPPCLHFSASIYGFFVASEVYVSCPFGLCMQKIMVANPHQGQKRNFSPPPSLIKKMDMQALRNNNFNSLTHTAKMKWKKFAGRLRIICEWRSWLILTVLQNSGSWQEGYLKTICLVMFDIHKKNVSSSTKKSWAHINSWIFGQSAARKMKIMGKQGGYIFWCFLLVHLSQYYPLSSLWHILTCHYSLRDIQLSPRTPKNPPLSVKGKQ